MHHGLCYLGISLKIIQYQRYKDLIRQVFKLMLVS